MSQSGRNLLREFWTKWLLWLCVWTAVALCFGHQSFIHLRKAGADPSWWQVIHWSLEDWYVWGLFSMGIFELARRFPLQRQRWLAFLALHGAMGFLLSPVYQAIRSTVCGMDVIAWRQPLPDVIVYWIILTAWHANYWRRESNDEALRAANLERQMVEAQLLALRMQLNPHFLFNTLNAIATLLRHDIDAAERMLVRLSELLRSALDTAAEPEVSLHKEVDFLERYVEIEQLRFGDRLNFVCHVSPDARSALVPNLILQPLVENAIKHGIENRSRGGRVELSATRSNGSLHLEIRDNGKAPEAVDENGMGVGLTNTRTRLETMYGDRQQMGFNLDADGCVVTLDIPFHTEDAAQLPVDNAHAA